MLEIYLMRCTTTMILPTASQRLSCNRELHLVEESRELIVSMGFTFGNNPRNKVFIEKGIFLDFSI